jgi:hypothetical protein
VSTRRRPAKRRIHWPRLTRDGVIFVGGLAGLFRETVLSKGERPTLIFACMAMIGLPAFLHADERSLKIRRGYRDEDNEDDDENDEEPQPARPKKRPSS